MGRLFTRLSLTDPEAESAKSLSMKSYKMHDENPLRRSLYKAVGKALQGQDFWSEGTRSLILEFVKTRLEGFERMSSRS